MRQDLTDHDLYRDLSKAGVPTQVALRAAWLLGGRNTLFVDSRSTPDDLGIYHEVIVLTTGRVVHVAATEFEHADSKGRKFLWHDHDVWARTSLTTVGAAGDEAAWDALLTDTPIAATLDPITQRHAMRQYVLTFFGRPSPVTIPLSPAMQDEADAIASCLAYDVKKNA